MSLGYMGYCKVFGDPGHPYGPNGTASEVDLQNGPSDPVLLLTTGGGVNMVLEPLYSEAIYGTGWYNAPESAHYADAAIRYEGSVSIDWQANADLWGTLRDWGVEKRAYARSVDISPNGNDIYHYWASGEGIFDNRGAFCTSMSMSTSAGSLVSGDVGVVALDREIDDTMRKIYIEQREGVTTGYGKGCEELDTTHPLNPSGRNTDPIPFWKTDAMLYNLEDDEIHNYQKFVSGTPVQYGVKILDWQAERQNNQQVIYTCGGSREAQFVLMGAISASGSVTMFHPEGVFDPIYGTKGTLDPSNKHDMYKPYRYAENTVFRVAIEGKMADGETNTIYFVELPAVVIEGEDFGFKGKSDMVTRQFNLKGLGGRCDHGELLPPHLLSDPRELYAIEKNVTSPDGKYTYNRYYKVNGSSSSLSASASLSGSSSSASGSSSSSLGI